MRIEFEQEAKEHISIIGISDNGERKEIGQIFTPSGSGHTNLNAIQICGFDEAFDLWGCGIFGDKENGNMKKDIQLCWFSLYQKMNHSEIQRGVVVKENQHHITEEHMKRLGLKKPSWTEQVRKSRFSFDEKGGICGKCFNHPCTCEVLVNHENPYTVKREQDLWLEKKKEDKKSSSSKHTDIKRKTKEVK